MQRKPRPWIYETKPIFKKVREPLVDVFREAKYTILRASEGSTPPILNLGSFAISVVVNMEKNY